MAPAWASSLGTLPGQRLESATAGGAAHPFPWFVRQLPREVESCGVCLSLSHSLLQVVRAHAACGRVALHRADVPSLPSSAAAHSVASKSGLLQTTLRGTQRCTQAFKFVFRVSSGVFPEVGSGVKTQFHVSVSEGTPAPACQQHRTAAGCSGDRDQGPCPE